MRAPAGAEIDLSGLRLPAASLLAAGVALPLLGHPGPGCPLRAFTGIPCPLCGMSTSVEATLQGDLGQALAANPMGIVAVAFAVWAFVRRGRKKWSIPTPVVWTTLSGMWVFQLFRFSIL
jgi:Protein of unknown function (DUF2752)